MDGKMNDYQGTFYSRDLQRANQTPSICDPGEGRRGRKRNDGYEWSAHPRVRPTSNAPTEVPEK